MSLPTVFLSHSTVDNEWCRCFAGKLQALGFDVWIDDQGILGADQFIQIIQAELERRDVFVVVLSPDSWASTWVQREIQLAMATNKTIVPVMHKPTSVQGFFRIFQWVDVIGKSCDDAAVAVAKLPALSGGSASNADDERGEKLDSYSVLVEPTALLNYAQTHVDDEIMKRAEREIDLWDKMLANEPPGFLSVVRDSLQIFAHARDIDRFFRRRWYASDENKRVLRRRCSDDWDAYLISGLEHLKSCCPPDMAQHLTIIEGEYPGLSRWLEDTLITNLIFAMWLGKRKLTETEVYYLFERLGSDRSSAIIDHFMLLSKAVKR